MTGHWRHYTYKLVKVYIPLTKKQKAEGKERRHAYRINVPAELGDLVPEDTQLRPELTEEGILFRVITKTTDPPTDLPKWANKEQP